MSARTTPPIPSSVTAIGAASQNLSIRFNNRLAETGIEPSVESPGNPYDNAPAESVIGLYKAEVIRRRGPWRSLEAVGFATLEYDWWFSHHRLLGPIGYLPPAKCEEAHYRAQLAPVEPSRLKPLDFR